MYACTYVHTQVVPDLRGFSLQVLTSGRCESNRHPVRTGLQMLNFDLFPSRGHAVRSSLLALGRDGELRFPVSPIITRGNN